MSNREPVSREEFETLSKDVRRIGCIAYLLLALTFIGLLADNFPPVRSILAELMAEKYLLLTVGLLLIGFIVMVNRLNARPGGE